MRNGSLTAKRLRETKQANCSSIESFPFAGGWIWAVHLPSSSGCKLFTNKNLNTDKRIAISYLTSTHSYFIIRMQSLFDVRATENTYAIVTVPLGYYPSRP